MNVEIFRLNENKHCGLEEYKSTAESFEIKTINAVLSFDEVYDGSGVSVS